MDRIPDIAECCRLMEQYGMLPNIRRHSIVVARVAWQLVDGLHHNKALRCSVPDPGLIVAGALLHDIAKTPCLRDGCEHARVGREICLSHGYIEVAHIVEEHVVLKNHDPQRNIQGMFTAGEIVYYADKRVRHAEIVSLEERLDYIFDHYGRGDPWLHDRIRKNFDRCVRLEDHLFSYLSFVPDRLAETVLGNSTISPPQCVVLEDVVL